LFENGEYAGRCGAGRLVKESHDVLCAMLHIPLVKAKLEAIVRIYTCLNRFLNILLPVLLTVTLLLKVNEAVEAVKLQVQVRFGGDVDRIR
jgi:hypothetical protein